jgi:hypothetical protein
MRINILILIVLIYTCIPAQAADLYISCDDISFIEILKTPPMMTVPMEGINGSCKGNDCFLSYIHLKKQIINTFYIKVKELGVGGIIKNIKVGEKNIVSNFTIDFIPCSENFYRKISDLSAYSKYEDAEERASSICPGKQIKYTGVMGKKSNSN